MTEKEEYVDWLLSGVLRDIESPKKSKAPKPAAPPSKASTNSSEKSSKNAADKKFRLENRLSMWDYVS